MTAPGPAVLVVDDDAHARGLLESALRRNGYAATPAADAAAARAHLLASDSPFALALCDLGLPGEHGLDLVAHIAAAHPDTAVVVVSGDRDPTSAVRACATGAYGYLVKPFGIEQLLTTVAGTLRRHRRERDRDAHAGRLEAAVRERTQELAHARRQTVLKLALAAELRDASTQEHAQRVGAYATLIAGSLGFDRDRRELLEFAALLHDVGKIGVPDRILSKPGPLSPEERRVIETHTRIGRDLLRGSGDELLELAATIAWTHHERIDGSGYPRGLRGEAIPVEGGSSPSPTCSTP